MSTSPVEDLGAHLETLGYSDVQRHVLQISPDACIALLGPYGSISAEQQFGSEAPKRYIDRIQVQVRGAAGETVEPLARATTLWLALHREQVTLSGTRYNHILPLQRPMLLLQDANKRYIWSFNLEVRAEV